ncbi:MAG: thioredoxin-disulfide reductase [Chloroflexi bacterium HGW-Chloroflexi-4]|jgi:thioredoxin reductase (NADPH)|nr:MAG: thioredoxin-disulfide reductase [Chloroflexi bacterium HGW-Chloroflexi-4]
MEGIEKVVVLGAGPAGYSAALYAARAELNPLVLTGLQPGGQAALTHTIENYPGFPDGVGGSELGDLFQKQAERFGARMEYDSVTAVDFSKRPFKINTYGKEILAEAVIIATGASPVKLNIPGEDTLLGKGVSYCATCDGWFFKEKKVAVVGGGDSALEEALFLTRYATEVTIIHRRDAFRAGAILQKRMHENPKIKLVLDSVVKEIRGTGKVENLLISNVKTGVESTFETDGIFIFIGHTPNNDLYKGQLEMDERNFIKVDSKMHTSVPGVFASGEAADADFKQVVTSAGMGAAAAIEAGRFLSE